VIDEPTLSICLTLAKVAEFPPESGMPAHCNVSTLLDQQDVHHVEHFLALQHDWDEMLDSTVAVDAWSSGLFGACWSFVLTALNYSNPLVPTAGVSIFLKIR
jgi:hypothetical protein